jgi:hypothetical protein
MTTAELNTLIGETYAPGFTKSETDAMQYLLMDTIALHQAGENNQEHIVHLIRGTMALHHLMYPANLRRNTEQTWKVFIKERAIWRSMKIKDWNLFCFSISQKICAIPQHHFKTEKLGEILGMLYGLADQKKIVVQLNQSAQSV